MNMMTKPIPSQIADLEKAIQLQETLRALIGDEVVDSAIAMLRDQLHELQTQASSPEQSRQQRKFVTGMLTDISGFTHLADGMDAEDLMLLMNQLWAGVDAIITRSGGWIEKHMGDSVLALWGVQTTREDDAEQAIHTAIAIHQLLSERWGHLHIMAHTAIHSGPVFLGTLGTKNETVATGPAISLLEQMEKLAQAGQIIISHQTYRLVRGLFAVEGQTPARGDEYETALQTYVVLEALPHIFRPRTRGVEGVETRMVGRDAELLSLKNAFQEAAHNNRLRILTIIGDAGLGKSRLLFEFEKWLDDQPESIWKIKARATERNMPLPYGLLRDAAAYQLEINYSDPLPVARAKFERGIVARMAEDPNAVEKAHFIGHLIGLDFSSSHFIRGIVGDPGQIRDRARHYLIQFFSLMATERPILFLFEDLHWADKESLDFIAEIARAASQLPIIFIGLTRPTLFERGIEWEKISPARDQIQLAPLTRDNSQELVNEILQRVEKVPPDLLDLIVEGAEGNPFYIEELVKMLIDEKVIQTGERWHVDTARLNAVHVPATLTGVLQARLDSLPAQERLTLECASVMGRIFWDESIQQMSDLGMEAVHLALESLRARELIFSRQNPAFANTREYVFKHAILRDVTYENILKRQRKIYHARAAGWLEARIGNRADEYASVIAEHYDKAEEASRAAYWYGVAGEQSFEAYSPETAISYFERAFHLANLCGMEEAVMFKWYEHLGKSLHARARFADALEAYQHMRVLAEKNKDITQQASAWYNISFIQDHMGDTRASLESAQQSERFASVVGETDGEILSKAYNGVGWAHYRLGDYHQALIFGNLSLDLSHQLADQILSLRNQAQAYQLIGAAEEALGNFEQSTQCEQKALETFRTIRDRRGETAMLNNQGVGAYVRGDYQQAIDKYQEAIELARRIGSRDRESLFLSNLGGAKVYNGEYESAERDLLNSIDLTDTRQTHYLPLTFCFLAEAYLGQGKLDLAIETARKGLKFAQDSEQPDSIVAAYRTLGNCGCALLDQSPGSLSSMDMLYPPSCYRESIRLALEIGADHERARSLWSWSRYEFSHGNPIEGENMWQSALALFEKVNLPLEIERMHAERSQRAGV